MTTKSELIEAIQDAADSTNDVAIKLSLGTPGSTVKIEGQEFDTGKSWAPTPKIFDTLMEGIADFLDAAGTGQLKSRLNEVIAALNQLIDDYNNSVHPTTATKPDPLP